MSSPSVIQQPIVSVVLGKNCLSAGSLSPPRKISRIEPTIGTTCSIGGRKDSPDEKISTSAVVTGSTAWSTGSPHKRITLTSSAAAPTPLITIASVKLPGANPRKVVYRPLHHTNTVSPNKKFPLILDKSRSIAIKNQKYKGPTPIVVPVVPAPALSIEALKDLSKQRAAKSHAIAARIIAESGAHRKTRVKPRNVPAPSLPLLSMEALKDMSSKRARESKDIAARILAEDKEKQQSPEDNRYPCPAKKMGPAHNKNTAHFNVPPKSPHGMPLICSHALCRKGRLKFVYCKYCNQPVSRMKFDDRHAHPEQLLMAFADCSQDGKTGKKGGKGGKKRKAAEAKKKV
jgi:hypothetical protein